MSKPTKGVFYAVNKGRTTGVFLTWEECEAQIKGFTGAKFRKFMNAAEAESFANGSALAPASPSKRAVASSSTNERLHSSTTSTKGKKRMISPDVEDERGWDVVYCDGACKGNGKAGSVAGVGVWWGVDDPRNIAERCPGDQTNNRAELIAILRILETTPQSQKPLLIKSDSQYSIKCFKEWLPGWVRNNYRTSTGSPVKNVGIIRYLAAHFDVRERNGQTIRLQYVKGHSGDRGNDGADAQANMGCLLPLVPERDWGMLEKQLRARVEEEWRSRTDKPKRAVMEIEAEGVKGLLESPVKIRRVNPETLPSQTPNSESTKNNNHSPKPLPPSKAIQSPPIVDKSQYLSSNANLLRPLSTRKVPETPPRATSKSVNASSMSTTLPSPSPPKMTSPRAERIMKILQPFYSLKASGGSTSSVSSRKSPAPQAALNVTPRRKFDTMAFAAGDHSRSPTEALGAPLDPPSSKMSNTTDLGHRSHTLTEDPPRNISSSQGAHSTTVDKGDIDLEMYADCVLDDDDLWKEID